MSGNGKKPHGNRVAHNNRVELPVYAGTYMGTKQGFGFVRVEELEDDIYLDDFKDEIDEWVIEELKKNGWSTARSVLEAPREMLIKNADLEEETVDEVLRVLRQEFPEEEEGSGAAEN